MTALSPDPSVLPSIPERKGTLNLRSDHMKYGRATLNSNWHADREAEPKDYDVCNTTGKRDLLRATYARIGNIDMPLPETTTTEALNEAHKLKKDFESRDTHRMAVGEENFTRALTPRHTGTPERGYGSVLPRYQPEHGARHLNTTQRMDYQYHKEWTPLKEKEEEEEEVVQYHHCLSEFTDTADHRRSGVNTWQDCSGSIRSYTSPSS